MAKTQADYEAEGAKAFREGGTAKAVGDSWQAKAYNRGWNDAQGMATGLIGTIGEKPRFALKLAKPLHSPRNSFTEQDRAMLYGLTEYMPHGAAARILDLQRQLRDGPQDMPNRRYWRLRMKVTALISKYSAKAARIGYL